MPLTKLKLSSSQIIDIFEELEFEFSILERAKTSYLNHSLYQ